MNTVHKTSWRLALWILVCAAPSISCGHSFYDRHVFFDNSHSEVSYFRSEGSFVSPSELALIGTRVPVATNRFTSPPNCLRLTWKSAPGGDWRLQLKAIARYAHSPEFEGDALSLWCFAEEYLSVEDSPRLALQDSSGVGSADLNLLCDCGPLPAGKWTKIIIPFDRFKPLFGRTDDLQWNPAKLVTIWLTQGLDDEKLHTVYVDDVQIVPREASVTSPAAPANLTVSAFERHFDLTWSAEQTPGLLKFQIYRSWDGEQFAPIGIQPGHLRRYTDYVDRASRRAAYRITAVDLNGTESALRVRDHGADCRSGAALYFS